MGHDLPRRADLLVSEIFDVRLLGEDALYTIKHALILRLRDRTGGHVRGVKRVMKISNLLVPKLSILSDE